MDTTLKDTLLDATLPLVPFDGWTQGTLNAAAHSIGRSAFDAKRAFPGGVVDAVTYFASRADAEMLAVFEAMPGFKTLKIRERIATAVMTRLRQQAAHREAIRRAVGLMLLPWNMAAATQSLYATVDAIWRAAGDTSTDYNFYTKRLLLSQVYTSTAHVWLDDRTDDLSETEAFLRRRIDDVMQIEKAKAKLREFI